MAKVRRTPLAPWLDPCVIDCLQSYDRWFHAQSVEKRIRVVESIDNQVSAPAVVFVSRRGRRTRRRVRQLAEA